MFIGIYFVMPALSTQNQSQLFMALKLSSQLPVPILLCNSTGADGGLSPRTSRCQLELVSGTHAPHKTDVLNFCAVAESANHYFEVGIRVTNPTLTLS
jgi:hypothetical protein